MKLVGRCAEQVIVQSDGSDAAGLVILANTGPDNAVSGMTFRNFSWGTDVGFGGQLSIADSVFEHSRIVGISVKAGGRVKLQNSVVRDTQPDAANHLGLGAIVSDEATLDVRDSTFDGNTGAGIWVSHPPGKGPGHLVMTDSVILNHKPNVDLHGQGLYTDVGATVVVDRSVFSNNAAHAIDIDGTHDVTLSNLVIRDTYEGPALQIAHGATVTLSRSLILNAYRAGAVAFHPGTLLSIQDSDIRGTQHNDAGELGTAVGASDGASIRARGTALIENGEGVQISLAGTTLALEQSLVAKTFVNSQGESGFGLVVQLGASAVLSEVSLLHTANAALLGTQSGASVHASKLLVLDTKVKPIEPPNGDGIFMNEATLVLSEALIAQSEGIGVAFSNASGALSDCTITRNAVGALFQMGTTAKEVEQIQSVQPLEVQVRNTRFVETA